MNILYTDATTSDIVAAVITDSDLYVAPPTEGSSMRGDMLCVRVQEALDIAGLTFEDIDCYACCVGPGSFTGIRIAIATMKGYHTVHPKGYLSVTSLEAIACSDVCGNRQRAVVDAGNGFYYYDSETGVSDKVISYDDPRTEDAGRGSGFQFVDGAAKILRRKSGECETSLKPLYIRRSQAEENRK